MQITIHTDNFSDHGALLQNNRLIEYLQLLPRLEVLELCTEVAWSSEEGIFRADWPSLFPSLRILRIPLRKLCDYVATTSAKDPIAFKVPVDKPEVKLACRNHFTPDLAMTVPFFKLLEEIADCFDTNEAEQRRLRIRKIDIGELQDTFYYPEGDEYEEERLNEPGNAQWYFDVTVHPKLATMLGLASERGGVPWPQPPSTYQIDNHDADYFVCDWLTTKSKLGPKGGI
jgi:hypothetical protein